MRPICRLPKDDCGTPMRPILSEQSGHTRIRTATSRVGRHAGNVFRISVPFPPGESAASLYACFYLKEFDCQAVVSHSMMLCLAIDVIILFLSELAGIPLSPSYFHYTLFAFCFKSIA